MGRLDVNDPATWPDDAQANEDFAAYIASLADRAVVYTHSVTLESFEVAQARREIHAER